MRPLLVTLWTRPASASSCPALQENIFPTHVVMNYGLQLHGSDEECGKHAGEGLCPYVPEVCEFLTRTHPFRVIWQTTTPPHDEVQSIPEDVDSRRHLHIPRMCNLDAKALINRGAILHELEPDDAKRRDLYHDDVLFSPAPYHAFNGRLVEMIASQDVGHGEVGRGSEQQAGKVQQAIGVQHLASEIQKLGEKVPEQAEEAQNTDSGSSRSRLRSALGR